MLQILLRIIKIFFRIIKRERVVPLPVPEAEQTTPEGETDRQIGHCLKKQIAWRLPKKSPDDCNHCRAAGLTMRCAVCRNGM
jgi:hypothetical protein